VATTSFRPALPANPPTDEDVWQGIKLANHIVVRKVETLATSAEVVATQIYAKQLLEARGGANVAPIWFAAAMVALDARFDQLDARFDEQDARFDHLEAQLGMDARIARLVYNQSHSTGPGQVLEEIPFLDGSRPWAAPHNLPQLRNRAAVNNLTNAQADAYLAGYDPGVALPGTLVQKKAMIRTAIGISG